MAGNENEADIDAESEGTTDTSAQGNVANTLAASGHGDCNARHEGDDGGGGSDRRPSLAASVRDAAERGESDEELIERVRASYEFDLSPRRAKRLVEAERDRIEGENPEFVVAEHAPRYADLDDVTSLTDVEFGRVVAYLLDERDGHGEIVSSADGVSDAPADEDRRDGERIAGSETVTGTEIRWHRAGATVLVRAVAAEPGRTVDGEFVRRVRERTHSVRATPAESAGDTDGERDAGDTKSGDGSENGGNEGLEPTDAAIVTVADVVPGAARLAVRSGIEIYDRADVGRWLDEERLDAETLGSLIEGA